MAAGAVFDDTATGRILPAPHPFTLGCACSVLQPIAVDGWTETQPLFHLSPHTTLLSPPSDLTIPSPTRPTRRGLHFSLLDPLLSYRDFVPSLFSLRPITATLWCCPFRHAVLWPGPASCAGAVGRGPCYVVVPDTRACSREHGPRLRWPDPPCTGRGSRRPRLDRMVSVVAAVA